MRSTRLVSVFMFVVGMMAAATALATTTSQASSPPAPVGSSTRGRAAFLRFQCQRCHDSDTIASAPVPEAQRCASCHQRAVRGQEPGPRKLQERWRTSVVHYLDVPRLDGLAHQLRRDWVQAFLLRPHDVRPGLSETMPRLAVSPTDAADLAAFLTRGAPRHAPHVWSARSSIEEGRALLLSRGCLTCHAFSGVDLPTTVSPGTAPRAPDLRHTRDRLTPSTVLRWLKSPSTIAPRTQMPTPSLSAPERESLARFIVEAPLERPLSTTVSPLLPVLAREVRFAEVEPILRACAHCHDDAIVAGGEGGPGHTGGMGFAPGGLDLSSYSAIARARFRGVSVTTSIDGAVPRLVQALQERRHEAAAEESGAEVESVSDDPLRGMPLGLPPLSPEEIQLVASWLAKGLPR
jgi:mono/diheme cytochrome c family protein